MCNQCNCEIKKDIEELQAQSNSLKSLCSGIPGHSEYRAGDSSGLKTLEPIEVSVGQGDNPAPEVNAFSQINERFEGLRREITINLTKRLRELRSKGKDTSRRVGVLEERKKRDEMLLNTLVYKIRKLDQSAAEKLGEAEVRELSEDVKAMDQKISTLNISSQSLRDVEWVRAQIASFRAARSKQNSVEAEQNRKINELQQQIREIRQAPVTELGGPSPFIQRDGLAQWSLKTGTILKDAVENTNKCEHNKDGVTVKEGCYYIDLGRIKVSHCPHCGDKLP